ncbi:MAG: PQQ-binding-like beta-propeller repeat protein, partial [Bradyrhizobium sp.]|nr:PQQ-binding-like beta-propeller repeat protein [Bradyrhizobium sp.]
MLRSLQMALMASAAVVAFTGSGLAASDTSQPESRQPQASSGQSGPSSQALVDAAKDTANWILPAGDYSDNRQLAENEISKENVDQMKVAWTFKIPGNGPTETSPIVWDGMVYITSNRDDIYALDAKTGELKWKYNPKVEQLTGFPRNRGVAVYDGMVFIGMLNGHLAALDAKTGKVIWDKQTVEDIKTSFYSMQPVPYKGKILMGVSDGDWGGIGNIAAFDPKTGNRIWQWDAVPKPGEPGHDSWSGDSWKRGGGAIWSGVAIDPKTDTLYVDLGNPQPDFLGTVRKGSNLYTNSMVALNISGKAPKMEWYHQFIPHDTHDWDPAMPPVLFTGKVDGVERSLVAAGDKEGNFLILDARTGKLVHHTVVSFQYGGDTAPSLKGNVACPNTNGGVEFNGGAFDPVSNTFFVPSINQCGAWKGYTKAVYIAGQFYLGGAFPKLIGPNWGWFNAIDVNTGVFSWRHYFPLPANGGALVMTDGKSSVVFTGELGGEFDAFDTKTGQRLWHYDTGASIIAPPATYVVGGQRYVAVASGGPGWLA